MSNSNTKKRKAGEPQREVEAAAGGSGVTDGVASGATVELESIECPVCFEPLKPPVYQCAVGHLICSSCCEKLPTPKKCHHCSNECIYNRCYGMEKVIGSVQFRCSNFKYGCTVKTSYYQKEDHEGKCPHAPCYCPDTSSSFAGSTGMLLSHFTSVHHWPFSRFKYGLGFHVKIQDGVRVLSCEGKGGHLFLLNVSPEPSGRVISLFCIRPYDLAQKFRCDIQFSFRKKNSIHTQSSEFPVPSTDFSDGITMNYVPCIVPNSYLDEGSKISLTLKKTSPVKISDFFGAHHVSSEEGGREDIGGGSCISAEDGGNTPCSSKPEHAKKPNERDWQLKARNAEQGESSSNSR
ncbi:hypothetical protein QOZ80_1BG0056670 [Eleusine coracana subsp. coracana]|nr:hypothetical protein QOZ80_1BG0056670 [Eleusine coracana subsp. coracana]